MPKIIDVKLIIESSIENLDENGLSVGDIEKTVSEAQGRYKFSEQSVILLYHEKSDGGDIRSEISYKDGVLTVKRSGAIESCLQFKEGESHRSIYSIPPYQFDAEVKARRIRVGLDENGGAIDLIYNMKIGGAEKSARMKIWISENSNQA